MSEHRPTPAYLRHRAEALRALSQQTSDKNPEYSMQLASVARKLDAKARELEAKTQPKA